jgi:hypothetical protein
MTVQGVLGVVRDIRRGQPTTAMGLSRENRCVTIRVSWFAAAMVAASCAANPSGQGTTPPSTTPITPSVSASSTMSRDQIERFKSRVDAALDEINPAKDTLAAALRTHDVAAIHIGCRPLGQAGRDLSAALAYGRDYALPDRLAPLVAQMQRAADDLQQAERDCLPLWTGSTEAEFDQLATDMQKVANEINSPPK